MSGLNQIRSTFLEFFEKNGHSVVPSAPLVPHNDPTLMFVNAGMVPFKNCFTGIEKRDYVRATSSQKCVRAGGKHNDLDNVGYTARHHTFFEMLGNFSFGDYFKEEAIKLAWDLVTNDFALPEERLLVTVYAEDDEAFDLWKKIGLPDSKILRIPTSDNFWSMGDTGPCGPCSEIFFDHGDKVPGGPPGSPDEDGDRFIEIWNLVFMQFDQQADGTRVNLPKPSIDTGMGLERIAATMQGTHDNYATDLFRTLIEASAHHSNTDPDDAHANSHRIIADHLRTMCFLIADGVLPSNEGRGYVLRRIMRRAMRHAHLIGCKDPLMHRLVPAMVGEMGDHFSELKRAEALISETLKLEETRFKKTLEKGLRLLEDETNRLSDGGTLAGDVAFKLYDTYGFPLDLTQDALKSKGFFVDEDGFNAAMAKQKEDARKAWSGSGGAATETVFFDLREKVGATDFLGYSTEDAEARIDALLVDGTPVDTAKEGQDILLIANQTPFYGESGGQVGDCGVIESVTAKITVTDTLKKLGDLHVHVGKVEKGSFAVGDVAHFTVDSEKRSATRGHHSATHLIHAALKTVLGEHVAQKGSLVGPDRLRFDISHPKGMSAEEIRKVEKIVNAQIRENKAVVTRLMSPEEAIEQGAMALFGEKYGDEVRVVSMGDEENNFSVELCGGTHVSRTGDIGFLKIISEGAVAAGVRRIEALTGAAAESFVLSEEETLTEAASALKTTPADLPNRLKALLDERKRLEKELQETRKKLAMGGGASAASDQDKKEVAGITFVPRLLADFPPKDLKSMADDVKKQIGTGIVGLVTVNGDKVSLVVGVTSDLTDKISAVDLVREGAAAAGGKGGGGRDDMAQAGGSDPANAAKALEAMEALIKETLS